MAMVKADVAEDMFRRFDRDLDLDPTFIGETGKEVRAAKRRKGRVQGRDNDRGLESPRRPLPMLISGYA